MKLPKTLASSFKVNHVVMKYFRLYLVLFLTIPFNNLHAQHKLYIGQVDGLSKSDFAKIENETSLAEKFRLSSLSESSNEIEIRFYQSSSASHNFCTIVVYDTIFKLKRITLANRELRPPYDSLVEINPIETLKADSVFKTLIENEIFNLPVTPEDNSGSYYLSNNLLIKQFRLCGITDGNLYLIDCKVGNVFKRIYSSSVVRALIECFPYNSGLQRRLAIINLMDVKYKLLSRKRSGD